MTIAKIEIWDFRPPYRDGSYVMSHVVLTSGLGRILAVTIEDGTVGLGEIVFSPVSTEEQRQIHVEQENARLQPLVGQPVESLLALADTIRAEGKLACGVAFGIETAALDVLAQRAGQSLGGYLGGAGRPDVPNYFSISERTIDRIQARLALSKQAGVVQLKIGVGSLQDDHDQIEAVLADLEPEQLLLADTNGGWSMEEAFALMQEFYDPRLIWEEPCDSYEENVELAELGGRPVMVDQCVAVEHLAMQAAEEGIAEAICIKPAFLGGIIVAKRIRDKCGETGVKMRIDGPWCGDIANAAILHLAVGAEPELLISSCDLREPFIIKPDLGGVLHRNGRLAPPDGPGLGVQLDREGLGNPVKMFS